MTKVVQNKTKNSIIIMQPISVGIVSFNDRFGQSEAILDWLHQNGHLSFMEEKYE